MIHGKFSTCNTEIMWRLADKSLVEAKISFFFFNNAQPLSSTCWRNILRPQRFLKCTARVRRWSPAEPAKWMPNNLLTRRKHWGEKLNVWLLLALTKAMFALWTAPNCWAFTEKKKKKPNKCLFFVIFKNERNLIPASRLNISTQGNLQARLNQV